MVQEFSNSQLETFIGNYRKHKKSEGGKYTLAELLLEQRRRTPSQLGTREVAGKIVDLSKHSADNLLTYGELWQSVRPGHPWKGNATQKIVSNSLYRVIGYCVANELPILTVVVVQGGNRQLSQKAV